MGNSGRLRLLIPPNVLFIAESGVRDRQDVARARDLGADGVLIGEALMRAADKKAALEELRGGL
jgi:indole-3-glycerol phosphate synthase